MITSALQRTIGGEPSLDDVQPGQAGGRVGLLPGLRTQRMADLYDAEVGTQVFSANVIIVQHISLTQALSTLVCNNLGNTGGGLRAACQTGEPCWMQRRAESGKAQGAGAHVQ